MAQFCRRCNMHDLQSAQKSDPGPTMFGSPLREHLAPRTHPRRWKATPMRPFELRFLGRSALEASVLHAAKLERCLSFWRACQHSHSLGVASRLAFGVK